MQTKEITEEITEEEYYFVVDLPEQYMKDAIEGGKQYKFVGLESNSPILLIGERFFQGKYVDTGFSHLIFEKNNKGELSYCNKTNQIYDFERVELEKKETGEEKVENENKNEKIDLNTITFTDKD
ncbi:transcription initiation factor iiic tfiiic [Anaeramoeba flamelloides]|uniref:Transcription initiation factor iiic tfiiic n=1 Tax=Anaeramoeba flamelloides TaxID=1746091 RepID=A0ABQ8X7D0_9EUKA|nr:transcription initiation factor iiic tfiiic [Anaeramoeba flamelloides]